MSDIGQFCSRCGGNDPACYICGTGRQSSAGSADAHLTAELLRIKNRVDTICNNVLCDMQPGWDDSIEGFNKAWDVVRDIFQEEIGRATQRALSSSKTGEGA